MKYFLVVLFIPILTFFSTLQTEDEEVIVGLNIGNMAPDLKHTSPDGTEYSLSQLRGKLVLIDFWASWCRPCRMENPSVVKAYNEFKDKSFSNGESFTVFGVSLDNSKDNWVSAIKSDGLEWEYHVSDLLGWKSELSAIYKVNSIPSNFLIDGKGIIIAKNLRGENLYSILKSFEKVNEFQDIHSQIEKINQRLSEIKGMGDYKSYAGEIEKIEKKIEKLNESVQVLKEKHDIIMKEQ